MSKIIIGYIQKHLLGNQQDVELSPEDDLLGSGLIDSLGMMRLLAFIENDFELSIPPEDMTIENFMTVEHIENYLQKRKSVNGTTT